MELTLHYLHLATLAVGVLGVLVIMFGVAGGVTRFVRAEWSAARGSDVQTARQELRQTLGYYLLLGLEFLIAADIIDTLSKPELRELVALGAIVAIRTVISYSLNIELTHHAHSARHSPSL